MKKIPQICTKSLNFSSKNLFAVFHIIIKKFPPSPHKISAYGRVGQIVVRRTSMLPPPPLILAVFMGVLVHNLSNTCCLPSTPKYPDHPLLSRILSTFSKLDWLLLPIDT